MSEQRISEEQLPESLRDPMKVLERGQAINKVGLNSWTHMDHYERAVRIAEEWWKSDEQRTFLVEIIKLAEQLGGFDHETKWKPADGDCTHCMPERKCPDHGACVTDGEI